MFKLAEFKNVYTFVVTATADTPFKLTTAPFWCRQANIHFLTNDARYGDSNINSNYPSIAAGNGISFDDFDLDGLYFMNTGAGSNTMIVAVCVKMTEGRKKELGITDTEDKT